MIFLRVYQSNYHEYRYNKIDCEIDSNSLKAINLSFYAIINKISDPTLKVNLEGEISFLEKY